MMRDPQVQSRPSWYSMSMLLKTPTEHIKQKPGTTVSTQRLHDEQIQRYLT